MLKSLKFYKAYASEFAEKGLGKSLNVPIFVNNRTKSLGSFKRRNSIMDERNRTGEHSISLNLKLAQSHDELLDTIKHEVIHWFCYTEKLDFKDGDRDFELLLNQHNVSSTHFGTRGKEQSTFIQEKIINGDMTRQGVKGVKYQNQFTGDVYTLALSNHSYLTQVVGVDALAKAYKVSYEGKNVGYAVKVVTQGWVMLNLKGEMVDKLVYKTRKEAVMPTIFNHEKQGKVS